MNQICLVPDQEDHPPSPAREASDRSQAGLLLDAQRTYINGDGRRGDDVGDRARPHRVVVDDRNQPRRQPRAAGHALSRRRSGGCGAGPRLRAADRSTARPSPALTRLRGASARCRSATSRTHWRAAAPAPIPAQVSGRAAQAAHQGRWLMRAPRPRVCDIAQRGRDAC